MNPRRSRTPQWLAPAAVLAAGAALVVWAATPTGPAPSPRRVRVFAAASLTAAMTELAQTYRRRTGVDVELSFASSGVLARQIEAGADADLYISANAAWTDRLAAAGAVDDDARLTLLTNRLVMVAPVSRPMSIAPAPGAAPAIPGPLAMGDPAHVPAGAYGADALRRLGWADELADRILPCPSVTAALRLAETADAAAAIVYASDAAGSRRVRTIYAFDPQTHEPIEYPAVAVAPAGGEARRLLAYLAGADAAGVFARHGFTPAAGGAPAATPTPTTEPPRRPWAAPLKLSVRVALLATAALTAPSLLLGWLLARRRFPGKALLAAAIHLPLVIPPVATGYLLLLALGANSPLGRLLARADAPVAFTPAAAVIASMVAALPLMVRSIRLSIEAVDPRLPQAARTLGKGPVATLATVTLPLAAPGLLAGCVLSFARSLGEFGATITFAGNLAGRTRTLPLAAYGAMQSPGGDAAAAQMVAASVALSVAAIVAAELLARRLGPEGR